MVEETGAFDKEIVNFSQLTEVCTGVAAQPIASREA